MRLPQIEQKGYSVQYRLPPKKPSDHAKLYLLELDRTVILFNKHKRNGSKNMNWFTNLLDNHRKDAHIDHDA